MKAKTAYVCAECGASALQVALNVADDGIELCKCDGHAIRHGACLEHIAVGLNGLRSGATL